MHELQRPIMQEIAGESSTAHAHNRTEHPAMMHGGGGWGLVPVRCRARHQTPDTRHKNGKAASATTSLRGAKLMPSGHAVPPKGAKRAHQTPAAGAAAAAALSRRKCKCKGGRAFARLWEAFTFP